jgi:hypothetical protein
MSSIITQTVKTSFNFTIKGFKSRKICGYLWTQLINHTWTPRSRSRSQQANRKSIHWKFKTFQTSDMSIIIPWIPPIYALLRASPWLLTKGLNWSGSIILGKKLGSSYHRLSKNFEKSQNSWNLTENWRNQSRMKTFIKVKGMIL